MDGAGVRGKKALWSAKFELNCYFNHIILFLGSLLEPIYCFATCPFEQGFEAFG
jgi:hypothetical protein